MYQPVLISSGLTGWQFLQRTYDQQRIAFDQSVELKRETDHFAEKISQITTAEELVADRQLLTVALGAFGLEDDINNTFFIQNPQSIGLPHFVENVQEIGLAPRPKDHRKRPYFSILGDGKQHTGQGAPDQMKKHVFHREIESLLFRTLHGVFDDRAVLFGVEDQTVADFETLFEKVGDFSDLSEVDFV